MHTIKSILLFCVGFLLFSSCQKQEELPNIVFVLADQYRANAMGFEGIEKVQTPNLDQLASEGVHFANAVSTVPICSPYRGMLMTGNYYTTNNVPTNCLSPNIEVELREDDYTILDGLNEAGYDVAYIGKWHLEYPRAPYVKSGNNFGPGKQNWDEWTPPERRHGVNYWYAYNTWDHHFRPHYWDNNSTRDERIEVKGEWSPIHETNKALEYIENKDGKLRDKKKPFAVFLSFNPPHTAYTIVPEEYKKLYEEEDIDELVNFPNITKGSAAEQYAKNVMKNYYASISGVDDQCGKLMTYLRENNLEENTIFIFTSDHGNCTGIQHQPAKGNHFEESFRVPLLVKWENKIEAGKETDLIFSSVDFFPTIMGMIGKEELIPEIQGTNLSEQLIDGTGVMPDMAIYANLAPGAGARPYQKDYFTKSIYGERGLRTKEYMLLISKSPRGNTQIILNDLIKDPFQLENIAEENMQIVANLWREKLNPKLEEIGDGWYQTPPARTFDFPKQFKPVPENNEVWKKLH